MTKKSHWIAQGETKEGITVVSYNEPREQAIVKINGTDKILQLRKGATSHGSSKGVTVMPAAAGFAVPSVAPAIDAQKGHQPPTPDVSNLPAPVVIPAQTQTQTQPAQPATPEAQAQQKAETEARMLVSDLLEIGMAQRKAYEEAQRKASEGKPAVETPKP